MGTEENFPPVIFTDDGWIMGQEPPVTADNLREKVAGSYAGTQGALGWSIGDHEVYHCELTSGQRSYQTDVANGGGSYSFVHSATPGAERRNAENLQALMRAGEGPLAVIAAECRKLKIPFFPRVRMNSHYVIDPAHPAYGSFRRERPDLLIGRPGEALPENSIERAISNGKDYAFTEVRDYMRTIIFESFERFDVDGVELDFMRHPAFFRIAEAQANGYLMTDLVRQVRTRLDQVAAERRRKLWLIARVPPTLADSVRIGLDVPDWIASELLDIVVAGGGFIPYETPVSEFVDAARPTGCRVYGCIEATRYIDPRNLRGLASRWYADGADGVYLYNFYTMSPQWNARTWDELSNRQTSQRLDKIHGTDCAGPVSPVQGHSGAFRYACSPTQLPVVLQRGFTGSGPLIEVRVADELERAGADGVLGPCTLALRLEGLTGDDRLEVRLNGQSLPWDQAAVRDGGWTRLQVTNLFWDAYPTHPESVEQEQIRVEFNVTCPPLRKGINHIEVHLDDADQAARSHAVRLYGIEITVTYQGSDS